MNITNTIRNGTIAGLVAASAACYQQPIEGIMIPEKGVCVETYRTVSDSTRFRGLTRITDVNGADGQYAVNYGGESKKPVLARMTDNYPRIDIERSAPADNRINTITNAGIDSLVYEAKTLRAQGAPAVDCYKLYR